MLIMKLYSIPSSKKPSNNSHQKGPPKQRTFLIRYGWFSIGHLKSGLGWFDKLK